MGYYVKNRRLQSGSTGVRLPVGSANDRPEYPTFGMIRYNTDSASVEFYDGSVWAALSAAGAISYTVDNFNADGSTTMFTMSEVESVSHTDHSVYRINLSGSGHGLHCGRWL
jgi:hypothetical protein